MAYYPEVWLESESVLVGSVFQGQVQQGIKMCLKDEKLGAFDFTFLCHVLLIADNREIKRPTREWNMLLQQNLSLKSLRSEFIFLASTWTMTAKRPWVEHQLHLPTNLTCILELTYQY